MNAVEILEWVRLIGPLLLIAFLSYCVWSSHRALKQLQKDVLKTHEVWSARDHLSNNEELF